MPNCQTCQPDKLNCSLEGFVTALKEPVVMEDHFVVRESDGSLRPLTQEEEGGVGIKQLKPLENPLKDGDSFKPYGAKDHCPFEFVIEKR